MAKKLSLGSVRIAHTRSDDSYHVVVAKFDDNGVLVSWPRALDFFQAIALNDENREVPEPLVLRDGNGWLTLCDGRRIGASASTFGHSLERLRYSRAVCSGALNIDYASVHGMTSEVDGLAKWTQRFPVTTTLLFDHEHKRAEGLSIVAKNLGSMPLGGPFNLVLDTSYESPMHQDGGIFKISTSLLVRTRSEDLEKWQTHQQTHRMVQDLMSLVYGKPCLSRIVSVMREDDQAAPPTDHRRYWHETYQPHFGRTIDSAFQLKSEDEPLFYLGEADSGLVSLWLSEYSYWSRPTWIAISALYQRNSPVESQLLQVAVALEALGYAIAEKASPGKKPSSHYETLLKSIFDSLGYDPVSVVGKDGDRNSWCTDFNKAYKGVKHADNPLTPSREAWARAREGLILIRCWLAGKLGVPEKIVSKRLAEGRVGA